MVATGSLSNYLSRLNRAAFRFYYLTWVMFLTWRKRSVPKWLQEDTKKTLDLPPVISEIEQYQK